MTRWTMTKRHAGRRLAWIALVLVAAWPGPAGGAAAPGLVVEQPRGEGVDLTAHPKIGAIARSLAQGGVDAAAVARARRTGWPAAPAWTSHEAETERSKGVVSSTDLSGDGRPDLLLYEVSQHEENGESTWTLLAFEAIDGPTGALLWRFALPDPSAEAPVFLDELADLNGDGASDLVITEYRPGEPSSSATCPALECERHRDWRWSLRVVDGATGREAWGRTIDGSMHLRMTTLAGGHRADRADAALLGAVAVQGRTGPGSQELLIQVVHATQAGTSLPILGIDPLPRYETVVTIADGATGEQVASLTGSHVGGPGALLPVGAGVGDAGTDLAWARPISGPDAAWGCDGAACAPHEPHIELEMLDGLGFERAWIWRADVRLEGWISSARVDLTDDGIPELFAGMDGAQVFVIDGRTGVPWWSYEVARDLEGIYYDVGAIGGAPGEDLIEVHRRRHENGFTDVYRFARIDGATGAELFSSLFPDVVGEGLPRTVWRFFGDVDGDDVIDLALATYGSWEDSLTIESGATAAVLLARSGWDAASLLRLGDIDDTAGDEWIEYGYRYDEENNLTISERATGLDGVSRWIRKTLVPADAAVAGLTLLAPGDVDGIPGSDVFRVWFEQGGSDGERFDLLRGSNGRIVWSYGDPLPITP